TKTKSDSNININLNTTNNNSDPKKQHTFYMMKNNTKDTNVNINQPLSTSNNIYTTNINDTNNIDNNGTKESMVETLNDNIIIEDTASISNAYDMTILNNLPKEKDTVVELFSNAYRLLQTIYTNIKNFKNETYYVSGSIPIKYITKYKKVLKDVSNVKQILE